MNLSNEEIKRRLRDAQSTYHKNVGHPNHPDKDGEEQTDPTHECQSCGNEQPVDDYQTYTPAWCESCDDMQTFEQIDRDV